MAKTQRVEVAIPVLAWAIDRSPVDYAQLEKKFPRLPEWLGGHSGPTFRQLDLFAHATATPLGVFFLDEPPEESLPIEDFRTFSDRGVGRASADLLETVQICEARQDWYRDYILRVGIDPLPFAGSLSLDWTAPAAAAEMHETLHYVSTARENNTFGSAFSNLVARAEDAGILVMVNGVVGANTHRKLSVDEFRGFTLADPHAPAVFVNGADTKAAQIFTLAHELAHVWLGRTGISNALPGDTADEDQVENWCNAVAAEFLVPAAQLPKDVTLSSDDYEHTLDSLGRKFKVSNLVILRRLHELNRIPSELYFTIYPMERDRLVELANAAPAGSGGDFYRTQPYKVSRRFARAVYADAAEGNTFYRDAYKLLGIKRQETFKSFAATLGVA